MNRFVLSAIAIFILLFSASCGPRSSSEGAASDSSGSYIENKGSDTIVNLALAWAEKCPAAEWATVEIRGVGPCYM